MKERTGKIDFVRKYILGDNVYEGYKCDDAELAKEFLLSKGVYEQLY